MFCVFSDISEKFLNNSTFTLHFLLRNYTHVLVPSVAISFQRSHGTDHPSDQHPGYHGYRALIDISLDEKLPAYVLPALFDFRRWMVRNVKVTTKDSGGICSSNGVDRYIAASLA